MRERSRKYDLKKGFYTLALTFFLLSPPSYAKELYLCQTSSGEVLAIDFPCEEAEENPDATAIGRDFSRKVTPKPKQEITQQSSKTIGSFSGKRMSLNFQEIELYALIKLISDFAKVKIILGQNVKNEVLSANYTNTPWDKVLYDILNYYNLNHTIDNNTNSILIY